MKNSLPRRPTCHWRAGLTWTWGGMRFQAAAAQQGAPSVTPNEFIYGSAFYRPPNPPREMRRELLRGLAQEYKFNIIRIYPGWDYYNPGPDKFVFDDVDEVMRYCDEFGVRVLLGAVLESAPWWLEQAHPECRYVDAKGQASRLAGSSNNMTGGWPGLCWDWQPIREAALTTLGRWPVWLRASLSLCLHCWNEPDIDQPGSATSGRSRRSAFFRYRDRTIAVFHQWLQNATARSTG